MNNLQSFSLSTNLSISEPYIQRDYFPLDIDLSKAILILNTFEDPRKNSRIYDFFQDVIDFAQLQLKAKGYFFFQPLTGKEPRLNCPNSVHNLTPNQIAYLIDNCAAILCNDNVYAHIANHANVKTISVFGPSSPIGHSPKFNSNIEIIRESSKKPSYRSVENPKTVNDNKVETVINTLYKILGMEEYFKSKTLYVGKHYPLKFIEIVPDFIINPDNFQDIVLTIRMDYHFNEEVLFNIVQTRKCNIITDKEINLDLIRVLKPNILNFNFKITKNTNIKYIKELIKTGVKIIFYSEESQDDLSQTRMNLFDLALVEKFEKYGVIPELASQITPNTYYRTNNFLLSQGKIYTSKNKYLKKEPIHSFTQNVVQFDISDDSLWDSLEFCRVFDLT